jgi:hypothetical protein
VPHPPPCCRWFLRRGPARTPGFLPVTSSASRFVLPSPSESPAHLRSSPRSCSPSPRCLSIRHTSVRRPRSRTYDIAPPFAGLWLTEPPPAIGLPGKAPPIKKVAPSPKVAQRVRSQRAGSRWASRSTCPVAPKTTSATMSTCLERKLAFISGLGHLPPCGRPLLARSGSHP